jgi:hypothetical protein
MVGGRFEEPHVESYRGLTGVSVPSLNRTPYHITEGRSLLRLWARLLLARAPRSLSSLPFGALSGQLELF